MSPDKYQPAKTVSFADGWQEYFAGYVMKTFDDFFDYPDKMEINKNNKRNVSVFTLGSEGQSKTFFIKRFEDPHYKDMLSALLNFKRPLSQAAVEWHNANALLANGIQTYRPVCFGQRTKWGLEKKSFFITEKLKSTEFVDFVTDKWSSLERRQQEKIIKDIAKLISTIHDCNFSLMDFYVWHIFIDETRMDDQCNLSVIDLNRMIQNVKSENKKISNVSRFYWSMTDEYFDADLKQLFLDSYMQQRGICCKSSFTRKVMAKVAKLTKKRKLKRY